MTQNPALEGKELLVKYEMQGAVSEAYVAGNLYIEARVDFNQNLFGLSRIPIWPIIDGDFLAPYTSMMLQTQPKPPTLGHLPPYPAAALVEP